jgi:hypothetical protein
LQQSGLFHLIGFLIKKGFTSIQPCLFTRQLIAGCSVSKYRLWRQQKKGGFLRLRHKEKRKNNEWLGAAWRRWGLSWEFLSPQSPVFPVLKKVINNLNFALKPRFVGLKAGRHPCVKPKG